VSVGSSAIGVADTNSGSNGILGYDGLGYFKGSMDEVRIYSRVLSATEIAALHKAGGARQESSATLGFGSSISSGLVTHWSMDDFDLGSQVTDRSSSNNHGYFNGGATSSAKTPGKLGQAISLDGSNDYVRGTTVINIPAATLSAWVYVRSVPTQKSMVMGFADGNGAGIYDKDLYIDTDGKLYFYVYDGAGKTTSAPSAAIPLNTWTHVSGTTDGTTARAYVDGIQVGSVPAGATYTSYSVPNTLVGGTSSGFPGYISATIDDARVYNRALSAAEIKQLSNVGIHKTNVSAQTLSNGSTLARGLIGYWSFDGADFTDRVYDRSGQAGHGWVSGAATTSIKIPGKSKQAITLDGVDDYIQTAFSQSVLPATITAWVKVSASDLQACDGAVFNRGAGSNVTGINIAACGDVTRLGYHWNADGSAYNWIGGPLVPTDKWFLSALVVEATKATLYAYSSDGLNSAVNNIAHTTATFDDFEIGRDNISGREFKGAVDEVRIYNRALSQTEILQLYNLHK
jgi:hypothetical protein